MLYAGLDDIVKEKELFLDFQNGSQDMFDYFFDKYYQGLCVYACHILKSTSEAEDLVQDFFVHILENRKNIRIDSCVKSYFIRSIHNRCLDYIDHKKVIASHELRYNKIIMTEEDLTDYPLLETELMQKIDRAILNLPVGIRDTFILSRFGGLSYQQISAQEKVSVKTVEYRISKALALLRKDFGALRSFYFFFLTL